MTMAKATNFLELLKLCRRDKRAIKILVRSMAYRASSSRWLVFCSKPLPTGCPRWNELWKPSTPQGIRLYVGDATALIEDE